MLSQALANQRREYFYYIFYILLLMAYSNTMWGVYGSGLENLKYDASVQPFMDKPLVMLSFFMYFRFARNFLQIPEKFKILNKRILIVEYILLGYSCAEIILLLVLGNGFLNELIYHVFALFNFVVSMACIFTFVRKQKTPLNYFVLAGSSTILMGAFVSLLLIVLKPDLPFPVITIFPCFVLLEIIIFTTGLVYKSKILAKQKLVSEKRLLEESLHKQQLEISMYTLRNKIAGDLHDDLGSTLGSIGVYAEAGIKNLESGNMDKASYILEKINLLSTDSLTNLREMVWVITPGKEKWKDLVDKMQDYGKVLLQSRNISLHICTEVDDQLHMSIIQRRNLYLIFKESIHNILKHSQAKNVYIESLLSEGNFIFKIIDDGLGIKNPVSLSGHGIKSMQTRAQELKGELILENNRQPGYGIQLKFPIQFQFT